MKAKYGRKLSASRVELAGGVNTLSKECQGKVFAVSSVDLCEVSETLE